MAKRIPPACTPANCGETFPKCGKYTTYTNRKCRCDLCSAAYAEKTKRYREANREKVAADKKRYAAENREKLIEYRKRYYLENREKHAESSKRYYAENREAALDRAKQYSSENRKAVAEYKKRHAAENREKLAEYKKIWREANRETMRSARTRWKQANPDRYRESSRQYQHRRRARMMATQVAEFTLEQMEQRYAYYGHKCYLKLDCCTGEFDHVDHVKPIAKGGSHILANLRPACKPCNERKSDQWPFKFAA